MLDTLVAEGVGAAEQLICVPGADLRGGVVGPSCVLLPRPSGFSWRLVRTRGGSRVDNKSGARNGWRKRLKAQLAREWGSVKEGCRELKQGVSAWVRKRKKGRSSSEARTVDEDEEQEEEEEENEDEVAAAVVPSMEERIARWESAYEVPAVEVEDVAREAKVKWKDDDVLVTVREFTSEEGRKTAEMDRFNQVRIQAGKAADARARHLARQEQVEAAGAVGIDGMCWDIASMSARRRLSRGGQGGEVDGEAGDVAEADGAASAVRV